MTKEEAEKVLEELNSVRPEQLKGEAKRLFEAIMKIADERDKTKQEYDRDTHILQNQLDLVNLKILEQDKIIDLMAKKINEAYFEQDDFELWFDKIIGVQEEMEYEYLVPIVKQYFQNKAKELINK